MEFVPDKAILADSLGRVDDEIRWQSPLCVLQGRDAQMGLRGRWGQHQTLTILGQGCSQFDLKQAVSAV